MRTIVSVAIITPFVATAGCHERGSTQPDSPAEESVSYISADEFTTTVAEESDVVLVEFCVPFGCFRCDEMRPQIDRLAAEQRDRLTICRVNFSQEPALTSRLGVSVCPSYVAFRDGEEVFRAAYPTSADLIVVELDEYLRVAQAE